MPVGHAQMVNHGSEQLPVSRPLANIPRQLPRVARVLGQSGQKVPEPAPGKAVSAHILSEVEPPVPPEVNVKVREVRFEVVSECAYSPVLEP